MARVQHTMHDAVPVFHERRGEPARRRGGLRAISRTALWVVGALAVLLLIARLLLPYYVHRYVNGVLNRDKDYRGRVGEITIHLWRGAYRIEDLKIEKMGGKVPVPLFSAPGVDLSVQWKELFHGAFVGEVELEHPELNFVHGKSKSEEQTGEDRDWTAVVRDLFPLRINRFAVSDGTVHYRDFSSEPNVDVRLTQLNGSAKNLTNSRKISKTLVASGDARATLENEAPVHLVIDIDPYAENPTFHSMFEMQKLSVVRLNDMLRAYANIDAKDGKISLFSDLTSDNGKVEGSIKPLITNLQLLQWKEDKDHPLHYLWQLVVSAVAEVFTNQRRDQIALVIPLSGDFKSPDTKGWEAFLSLAGNAFIKAIRPGLEDLRRESEPAKGSK